MSFISRDPKSYFSTFIGALIVIAIALSFFIYSLLKTTPEEIEPYFIDTESEVPAVNPGNLGPSGPPGVPFPTEPPPTPVTTP